MPSLSARSLGELALPGFCPRCFWIVQHLQGSPPFQFGFPGIFRDIDAHTKALVRGALEQDGAPPAWFPAMSPIQSYLPENLLHWRRFAWQDTTTGIQLRGVPDEVLQLADGSYHIMDYKTARITTGQDALMPLYEVQLNAYATIAEALDYGPVSGLSLLYLEPQVGQGTDGVELNLGFQPAVREVARQPGRVQDLLRQAGQLLELNAPPAGREGCSDCRQLTRLLDLVR